ncbi:redoxin family protein [Microlunatus sp. Y2014]|uniref:TlpA family protein disulfide reductase n=1 Tax=Microlunatus sp. Y2014 TaxID=3418488 RepID=UPI003DA71300
MTSPSPVGRRSLLGAAALGVASLGLAGCTSGAGPVTRRTGAAPPTSGAEPPAPVATELAERKAAAGIAACPVSDPNVPAREDGLPDITLPCLGGGSAVRLAGLRGTPWVINIWAQWCPPCRQEAPHLATVSKQLAGQVSFLGVDYQDPRPDYAIDFAAEAGWTYPQVADEDRQLQVPFQIVGPPMTLLVTADGRLAHRHVGMFTSAEQLAGLVAEHLAVP